MEAPLTGWWRDAAPAAIPSKEHLHRSFTAVLEPPAATYERYNTAALADGSHGGGAVGREHSMLRVLDAGCGDGRIALGLARAGCDVVGVDVNAAAVSAANASAAEGLGGAAGGGVGGRGWGGRRSWRGTAHRPRPSRPRWASAAAASTWSWRSSCSP